ncbi:MAG: glycosyltransferase family 2 protein, partial [Chitinophagaceae bacterium]
MNKYPKISIVTPSFNQGKYIEQTILSVINQGYPNLEYIIIDGGSTDETISIVKKYEQYITYWVSEPDKGQSDAINKGLAKCTGEIFNWLNSDDWYPEGTLLAVAEAFNSRPGVRFVSGYENHIEEGKPTVLHKGTYLKNTLPETIELCEMAQPSTFVKLADIKKVGGVSNELHYIMDGELWVKLLLQFGQEGFLKLERILVNFRLHAQSKTVSNAVVDNFLLERSSIIYHLQSFLGLPNFVKDFYLNDIFGTKNIKQLHTYWQINEQI